MAELKTLITKPGTRHKLAFARPCTEPWMNGDVRLVADCNYRIVALLSWQPDRPAWATMSPKCSYRADCKDCFPSSDASLGAAEGERQ